MDKYSFPSTQNTMKILVYFSLLTAFRTQRNYKDNRNGCSWTLKSSTKSRVQKRGMVKAKSKDWNITCLSVKTSVSENRNQSTNYCLHDQYYTGHSVVHYRGYWALQPHSTLLRVTEYYASYVNISSVVSLLCSVLW